MNDPIAIDAPQATPPDTRPPPNRRRVADAPTRMFHWLSALCFLGAYLTSEADSLRELHRTLGYTLAGLWLFRLAYGLLGPRQVRLSAMANRIRTSLLWLHGLPRALAQGRVNWQSGQNTLMALAIAAMLLLVPPLTLSGWAVFNELGGEWLEDLHETMGNAFLLAVLAHLGLLLALSLWRRKNLALPMWSGRVPGVGPDLVRQNRAVLALLMLAACLWYWRWEWQQSPKGLISSQALWQALSGDDEDED